MHKSANSGALALTLAVLGLCGIDPARAQTQDLVFGKHLASAAFPCTPQRQKTLAGKSERGADIFLVMLTCTQGDHTYALQVMEYPPEVMGANSVDDLLESYKHNAGAKKHVRIKTSQRMTHKGFPAIRYHVLDTRAPEKELIMMSLLVDRSLLTVHVHARSGILQAAKHATFADSLNIRAGK
jgi:hypothetical protein